MKKNREVLTSVIGAVVIYGRQNIALHGKTESRSNFRAIIDYRAEKDDLLSDHLATAPNMQSTCVQKFRMSLSVSVANKFQIQ